MTATLHLGDCVEFMRTLPDKSVDHVIADPPYSEHVHNEATERSAEWRPIMVRPEDVAELADPAKSRQDEIERHFDFVLAQGASGGEAIVGRTRNGWRLDDIAAVLDGYRRAGWIVDEVPAGYRFRRAESKS